MSGAILRRRDRTARSLRVVHYSSAVNILALPATTLRDEHITVTLIDRWLPDRARQVLAGLADLLTAAMLAALAPYLWRHAGEVAQYGDVTLYLQIETAPFVYVAAVMTGLASVLAAARFVGRAAPGIAVRSR